jgi:hypothetical protein
MHRILLHYTHARLTQTGLRVDHLIWLVMSWSFKGLGAC